LSESLTGADRAGAVRSYLKHLDLAIAKSPLDAQDQAVARETDRQGLGLTRRTKWVKGLATRTGAEKVRCRKT